jgi:hypothetical protein
MSIAFIISNSDSDQITLKFFSLRSTKPTHSLIQFSKPEATQSRFNWSILDSILVLRAFFKFGVYLKILGSIEIF